MKKGLFLTILLVVITVSLPLFSLSIPKIKSPKKPGLSHKQGSQSKNKLPLTPFPVTVHFFKAGVHFQGTVLLQNFTLQLVTEKQGFRFYKKLSLNQIKSITILKWKGRFYAKKQKVYLFLPVIYQIEDFTGNRYLYKKNIRSLNRMDFKTTFGRSRFYTYYFDYIKGKKWAGLNDADMSMMRHRALPKVVKKLVFSQPSIKKHIPSTKENITIKKSKSSQEKSSVRRKK